MSTAAKIVEPCVMSIEVSDDEIIVHLVDERTISVPLKCLSGLFRSSSWSGSTK